MIAMPEDKISYIKSHLDKPVVLVGMMGTGKTSIGQALARTLDMEFQDSDRLVEQKAAMGIPGIFEEFGEEKFRSVEKTTILELLERAPQVIATGGGAVLNEETRQYLQKNTISIWIQSDLDTLYKRVSKNRNRPLLQTDNPKETLGELMRTREKFYAKAHIHYQTGNNSIDETLQALIERLYKYIRRDCGGAR